MTKHKKFPHWIWPLSIAAAGVGTAAAVLLRGCWHRNIGWPVSHDENYSYVVCTDCGIKRLFDEKLFREYGPYGYDIEELIAQDRVKHIEYLRRIEVKENKLRRRSESTTSPAEASPHAENLKA